MQSEYDSDSSSESLTKRVEKFIRNSEKPNKKKTFNLEIQPLKLRPSIVQRALKKNVVSSTPMHVDKYFSSDSSFNLSPIRNDDVDHILKVSQNKDHISISSDSPFPFSNSNNNVSHKHNSENCGADTVFPNRTGSRAIKTSTSVLNKKTPNRILRESRNNISNSKKDTSPDLNLKNIQNINKSVRINQSGTTKEHNLHNGATTSNRNSMDPRTNSQTKYSRVKSLSNHLHTPNNKHKSFVTHCSNNLIEDTKTTSNGIIRMSDQNVTLGRQNSINVSPSRLVMRNSLESVKETRSVSKLEKDSIREMSVLGTVQSKAGKKDGVPEMNRNDEGETDVETQYDPSHIEKPSINENVRSLKPPVPKPRTRGSCLPENNLKLNTSQKGTNTTDKSFSSEMIEKQQRLSHFINNLTNRRFSSSNSMHPDITSVSKKQSKPAQTQTSNRFTFNDVQTSSDSSYSNCTDFIEEQENGNIFETVASERFSKSFVHDSISDPTRMPWRFDDNVNFPSRKSISFYMKPFFQINKELKSSSFNDKLSVRNRKLQQYSTKNVQKSACIESHPKSSKYSNYSDSSNDSIVENNDVFEEATLISNGDLMTEVNSEQSLNCEELAAQNSNNQNEKRSTILSKEDQIENAKEIQMENSNLEEGMMHNVDEIVQTATPIIIRTAHSSIVDNEPEILQSNNFNRNSAVQLQYSIKASRRKEKVLRKKDVYNKTLSENPTKSKQRSEVRKSLRIHLNRINLKTVLANKKSIKRLGTISLRKQKEINANGGSDELVDFGKFNNIAVVLDFPEDTQIESENVQETATSDDDSPPKDLSQKNKKTDTKSLRKQKEINVNRGSDEMVDLKKFKNRAVRLDFSEEPQMEDRNIQETVTSDGSASPKKPSQKNKRENTKSLRKQKEINANDGPDDMVDSKKFKNIAVGLDFPEDTQIESENIQQTVTSDDDAPPKDLSQRNKKTNAKSLKKQKEIHGNDGSDKMVDLKKSKNRAVRLDFSEEPQMEDRNIHETVTSDGSASLKQPPQKNKKKRVTVTDTLLGEHSGVTITDTLLGEHSNVRRSARSRRPPKRRYMPGAVMHVTEKDQKFYSLEVYCSEDEKTISKNTKTSDAKDKTLTKADTSKKPRKSNKAKSKSNTKLSTKSTSIQRSEINSHPEELDDQAAQANENVSEKLYDISSRKSQKEIRKLRSTVIYHPSEYMDKELELDVTANDNNEVNDDNHAETSNINGNSSKPLPRFQNTIRKNPPTQVNLNSNYDLRPRITNDSRISTFCNTRMLSSNFKDGTNTKTRSKKIAEESHIVQMNDEYVELQDESGISKLKFIEHEATFTKKFDNLKYSDALEHTNGGSMVYLEIPPGELKNKHTSTKHCLFFFVCGGRGRVYVGNKVSAFKYGSRFVIPTGLPYSIINDSQVEPLLLACVRMKTT